MDWLIGDRLVDWSRIDTALSDWHWIGEGLTYDWQIGDGLVDWSRIDIGLAMDWNWIGGGLVMG